MKTIKYYLSQLPYPINKKALYNYNPVGYGYCGSLKIALILAFDWDKTHEGHSYWNNVYNGNYSNYIREEPKQKKKASYKKNKPKKRKAERVKSTEEKYVKFNKHDSTHGVGKNKTYHSIDEALENMLSTNHAKNL